MARIAKHVTVSFPPELLAEIDRQAKEIGITRSAVIQQATREHLAGPGQFAAAMSNPTIRNAFAQAFGRADVVKGLASAMAADAQPEQLRLFEDSIKAAVGGTRATATDGGREYRSPGQPVSGGDSKRSTVRAGGDVRRVKPSGAGRRTKRGGVRGTKRGTSHH